MASRSLLIMCGLPFSGKSTLARAISDRFGLIHTEVDWLHRDRGAGEDGRRLTRQEWTVAYWESYGQVDTQLGVGASVVFDAVNHRLRMRDRLRHIARRHGVRPLLVLVALPVAEIEQRRRRNAIVPARVDVPEEDFREVAATFEVPQTWERVVLYNNAIPLDKWLVLLDEAMGVTDP